jgi:hypothetical protein
MTLPYSHDEGSPTRWNVRHSMWKSRDTHTKRTRHLSIIIVRAMLVPLLSKGPSTISMVLRCIMHEISAVRDRPDGEICTQRHQKV